MGGHIQMNNSCIQRIMVQRDKGGLGRAQSANQLKPARSQGREVNECVKGKEWGRENVGVAIVWSSRPNVCTPVEGGERGNRK